MAQGIGKKIAQRIILELKDKLAKGQSSLGGGELRRYRCHGDPGATRPREAAAALAVLGYGPAEISLRPEGHGHGRPLPGGDHPPGPEKT